MNLYEIIEDLEKLNTFDEKLNFLSNISILGESISESEIKKIDKVQKDILNNKPTLGATKWIITKAIQILPNIILVYMEDGHLCNIALIDKTLKYKVVWEESML